MCRIFGFLGNAKDALSRVQNTHDLLHHGGPDGNGLTVHNDSILGSCRLAIMDINNGSQPYTLGDKIEAVFNGEIYNHDKLRRILETKGYVFHNHCDGAIIPALYNEYGDDFVAHIDGMFAIAILDRRVSTKLLLAVDHLGMKPIYYNWNEAAKQFSFASEIPALLSIGNLKPSIWLPGVDEYLTAKIVMGGRTSYDGINILEPQTMLTFSAERGLDLKKWARSEKPTISCGNIVEASLELEKLISHEVSSLLCADVPVATINSGGLDSSLVSALATYRGIKPQAFHLAYSGNWPSDERLFAHQVAEKLQISQHDIMLDPADFSLLLPEVVCHMGQPFACPNNLSTYGLFRGVKEKGFKVVLSGDGADEMFGGYSRLQQLAANHQATESYINSLGILTPQEREKLYSQDYAYYLKDKEKASQRLTSQFQAMPGETALEKALEFERTVRLPAYHLRRIDHLSMAHSVEVRVPFCQHKVLDFARSLPIEYLLDKNATKKVLYAAASGHLPSSVLNRPKQPFTLPVGAMFRESRELSSFARDVLSNETVHSVGFFDKHAVAQLFEKEKTCSTGKTAEALWALMIFHLWATQPSIQPIPTSKREILNRPLTNTRQSIQSQNGP